MYSHATTDGYGTRSFRDWAPGEPGFASSTYGPEDPYEHIEVPGAIFLDHSISVIYNRSGRGVWFDFDMERGIVSACIPPDLRLDLTELRIIQGSFDDTAVGHRAVDRCP